jgi:hypothetical protein
MRMPTSSYFLVLPYHPNTHPLVLILPLTTVLQSPAHLAARDQDADLIRQVVNGLDGGGPGACRLDGGHAGLQAVGMEGEFRLGSRQLERTAGSNRLQV